MRLLIDGYNVMHAAGLLGKPLGPEKFRRVRQRFLNNLAKTLDPVDAHQTTVVFDAADPPPGLPREYQYKGLTVIYAVDAESADERIEQLIAQHSAPKSLTVVSTDHRIRNAAVRRKARVQTADNFLEQLEIQKRVTLPKPPHPAAAAEAKARSQAPSPQESAYWLEQFRDLAETQEVVQALRGDSEYLSDADIARIEREVEEEFRARYGR